MHIHAFVCIFVHILLLTMQHSIYQICKISIKIPKYAINIPIMQNHTMEPLAVTQRQQQNTRHHYFENVLWHLAPRPQSKVILCVVHVDFHKFHFMCKYSQYAIYAITYLECTICKSIPNMQHVQKHPTFAIYAKYTKYAQWATKYQNMQ